MKERLTELKEQFSHLDIEAMIARLEEYENERGVKLPEDEATKILVLYGMERISQQEPDWTYVCSRLYTQHLYRKALDNRGDYSFSRLIHLLIEEGVYDEALGKRYTAEEMNELESVLDNGRDQLFTYIGIKTLSDRYLAKKKDGAIMELPQERWMVIAMTLLQSEKGNRMGLIKEAYWALSNLYMTVATPTLSNAGKQTGQLSSCFIDTVEDDLMAIYDSNTDVADLSKNGGGIGVYMGKLRSRGSDIQGYKGVSGGVIPWMKQLNNTAVSVDQLGQRQGAICVYLDVWHRDIQSFLDVRLNNGDERLRTHDIFIGVCLPDLFMERVEERGTWYLFDPHEVKQMMGYSIEDCYDEEKGNGTFRRRFQECVDHPLLSRVEIPAIEIMKKIMISQLETGTPFIFYRDEVNRKNPNSHKGMIYCSNLCTEIAQNMSPTVREKKFMQDGKMVTVHNPGDFVVCNLSSVSLARVFQDEVEERVIPIQVRLLDNVIDLNRIPVLQAQHTNMRYRAVGLGTYGWHHLLAIKGVKWESDDAVSYCDDIYKRISYLTIQASMELAKEKGSYPLFEGSDWQTGEYFRKRDLNWPELQEQVAAHGIRNGYLMAVAPNSSTALIAGSTSGVDPIFRKEYSEEKKDYKIPVTAPDLNATTTWLYKTAYHLDQHWSIKQNEVRQRYVDQGISFNLYVSNDIPAIELLNLHMRAWKSGMKTTYYVRSQSGAQMESCESCT